MSDFENFNLNDVDPNYTVLPEGVYTYRVNSLSKRELAIKNGKDAGTTKSIVKGAFAVVDNDTHAGKRVWKDFWLDNGRDAKALRRIMDTTGIQQTGTFEQWLDEITTASPTFKGPTKVVPDAFRGEARLDPITGQPQTKNEIDFRSITPA